MLKNKHKFNAFTLAEMMVVMLIMSIVLAAMAPVMTTKNKVDNSSPWKYSPNNSSDAYFGQGASMRAMIGQLNGEDTDNGKLIINNLGSSFSHILFKNGNTILGDLYLNGTSLVLGNRQGNNPIGNENINIGHDNWPAGTITGSSNITIGDASMTSLTSGSHNIGLGTTLTSVTTGEHNIGIGDDSLTNITGNGNIAIGGNANATATTASKTIAIGTNSVASSIGAIAIGSNLTSSEAHGAELNAAQARVMNSIAIGNNATSGASTGGGQYSIAIGTRAEANSTDDSGSSAIAIGYYPSANGTNSIAIGNNANANVTSGVALGDDAGVGENYAIAIGHSSRAEKICSIAIGNDAHAAESNNIAIGSNAKAPKDDSRYVTADNIAIGNNAMGNSVKAYKSIAIGAEALNNIDSSGGMDTAIGWNALGSNTSGYYNTAVGSAALYYNKTGASNTAIGSGACQYVTGSNKTCIGYDAGPSSNDTLAKNNEKVVYLGDADTTVYIPGNLVVGNRAFIGASLGDSGTKRNCLFYNSERGWHGVYGFKNDGDRDSWWFNMDDMVNGRMWNDFSLGFTLKNYISDRRLKYVGTNNNDGLAKIKQLKVFNYVYKKDTTKTPHVGVIAQDLQKVFPNAVKKGTDGFLTIRMEDMFYAVINAIKELDAKYQAQEKRINDLEKRIEKLEAKK